MRDILLMFEYVWLVLQLPEDEKTWCANRLRRARASVSYLFGHVSDKHNFSSPLVLGDERVHMDPPRWFGRRKTDWSRRRGIFSFNGLMSLIMAVPIMFYRTENFETMTVVFRWFFTALVIFGIGAIVARRDGLDRATAQACLASMGLAWVWLMAITKMYDPTTLTGWTTWLVAFGLAVGMAMLLVSGLTLLVCVVMAYLPRARDGEIA